MIIDFNFFGLEEGSIWDTPVAVDMLDELQFNEGVYDEAYVDVNTDIGDSTARPDKWTNTTVMSAKFAGNLNGGSIGIDGFNITQIQLYRSIYGSNKWDAIGQFDYTPEYNIYDYVDRYIQNGTTYQYAIVPKANEILGEMSKSDEIKAEFEGIYITDRKENRKLEYDIQLGDLTYNNNSSINQPLNGKYPVAVFGNSKYRSGSLTVLPLSKKTVELYGNGIDKLAEQLNRQEWLDFLNNAKPKVLRMDNGVLMLVVTQNATVTFNENDNLRDLAHLAFNYTEVGELDFETMLKGDLIPSVYAQKATFDDYGGIISG